MLLIGLILVCGLITGWVKLRDNSSAEIKDTLNAIDSFIAGSAATFQPYAQPWITGVNGTVGCSPYLSPQPAVCSVAISDGTVWDPPYADGEGPNELIYVPAGTE